MNEKTLYETAILSLGELPAQDLSLHQSQLLDVLQELLPASWEQGSREAQVVSALLTGQGEVNAAAFALDPQETARLLRFVENARTEGDWSRAMQDLGWHCLEALEPVWTEELLP